MCGVCFEFSYSITKVEHLEWDFNPYKSAPVRIDLPEIYATVDQGIKTTLNVLLKEIRNEKCQPKLL